jgi:hypothetical protein
VNPRRDARAIGCQRLWKREDQLVLVGEVRLYNAAGGRPEGVGMHCHTKLLISLIAYGEGVLGLAACAHPPHHVGSMHDQLVVKSKGKWAG